MTNSSFLSPTDSGNFSSNEFGSHFGRRLQVAHRINAAVAWNRIVPPLRVAQQWVSQVVYDMNHGFTQRAQLNPFQVARRDASELTRLTSVMIDKLTEDIAAIWKEQGTLNEAAIKIKEELLKVQRIKTLLATYSEQCFAEKLNRVIADLEGKEADVELLQKLMSARQRLFNLQTAWLAADEARKRKETQLLTNYNHRYGEPNPHVGSIASSENRNRGLTNKYPAVLLGTLLAGPVGLAITACGFQHVKRALYYGAAGLLVAHPGRDVFMSSRRDDQQRVELPPNLLPYQNTYWLINNGDQDRSFFYIPKKYEMNSRAFPLPLEHYRNSYIYLTDTKELYYVDREARLERKTVFSAIKIQVDDINALFEGFNKILSSEEDGESGLKILRVLPQEFEQHVVVGGQRYQHIESNPRSPRGLVGLSFSLPVIGSFLGAVGIRNMGLAVQHFGRGLGVGLKQSLFLGYRPFDQSRVYRETWRRASRFERAGMVFSFLPSFLLGAVSRALVDNLRALKDGVVGGWVSGFGLSEEGRKSPHQAGFDDEGTLVERMKKYARAKRYSALFTLGFVGFLSYASVVPIRSTIEGVLAGFRAGFSPLTKSAWALFGNKVKELWSEGNYGIAIGTTLVGALTVPFGAVARAVKDLGRGVWSGFFGGLVSGFAPLRYQRYRCETKTIAPVDKDIESNVLYLIRKNDNSFSYALKNSAGEICKGDINAQDLDLNNLPENLNELSEMIENRSAYLLLLEKISKNHSCIYFAESAGFGSQGTLWERTKHEFRSGNVFAGVTLAAFGAIGAVTGAFCRSVCSIGIGFWQGLVGGCVSGFSPFKHKTYQYHFFASDENMDDVKPEKGHLYLKRMADRKVGYKVMNPAGEVLTGSIELDLSLPDDLKLLDTNEYNYKLSAILYYIQNKHASVHFSAAGGFDGCGTLIERVKDQFRSCDILGGVVTLGFGAISAACGAVARCVRDMCLGVYDGFFGGLSSAFEFTNSVILNSSHTQYQFEHVRGSLDDLTTVDEGVLYVSRSDDRKELYYKIKNLAGEICEGTIEKAELGYTDDEQLLPDNLSALKHPVNEETYNRMLREIALKHALIDFSNFAGVLDRGTFWHRFKNSMKQGRFFSGVFMLASGIVGAIVGSVGRIFHDIGLGVYDGFLGGGLLGVRAHQKYQRMYQKIPADQDIKDGCLYIERLSCGNVIQYAIKNAQGEIKRGRIEKNKFCSHYIKIDGKDSTQDEKLPEFLESFEQPARRPTLVRLLTEISKEHPEIRFKEAAGFDDRGTFTDRFLANVQQGSFLSAALMIPFGALGAMFSVFKGAVRGLYNQFAGGFVSGFFPLRYTAYRRLYKALNPESVIDDNSLYLERKASSISYKLKNKAGEIFQGEVLVSDLSLDPEEGEHIPEPLSSLEDIKHRSTLQKVLSCIEARHDNTIHFAETAGFDSSGTFFERTKTLFRQGNVSPAIGGFVFAAIGAAIGAATRIMLQFGQGFWDGFIGGVVSAYSPCGYTSYKLEECHQLPDQETLEKGKIYLLRKDDNTVLYKILNDNNQECTGEISKELLGFSEHESLPQNLKQAFEHISRIEALKKMLSIISGNHSHIYPAQVAGFGEGTWQERFKAHARQKSLLSCVMMGFSGILGGVVGGVARIASEISLGTCYAFAGVMSSRSPDQNVHQGFSHLIKESWGSSRYIQAMTMAIVSPCAFVARQVVDFFRGIVSGIFHASNMAGSQFQGDAWSGAKESAENHRTNHRYAAFVGASISGLIMAPVVLVFRQVVDFFRGIVSGIFHASNMAGSQFQGDAWSGAKASAENHRTNHRYAAFVGASISGLIMAPVVLVCRQVFDFFRGIVSGIFHASNMAGSQFQGGAWSLAKESAENHRTNHRYAAFVGASISGLIVAPVVLVFRQVVDFFRGIVSGIFHAAKIAGNQFQGDVHEKAEEGAENDKQPDKTADSQPQGNVWQEAKKSAENHRTNHRYAAFVGASISGLIVAPVVLVFRQVVDFFRGIVSGIFHASNMAGSQFQGDAWSGAKASAENHRTNHRYAAFVGASISGLIMAPVVLVCRQVFDFFKGVMSGIKNSFVSTCGKKFFSTQGFSDDFKSYKESRSIAAVPGMVLGTLISMPLACVVGALSKPRKVLLPITLAPLAAIGVHVVWKSIKSALLFPVRAVYSLFKDGKTGGVAYAFAKVASMVSKLLPGVRRLIPAFRTWDIAMKPLKEKWEAIPKKGNTDNSPEACRSQFLDQVSGALLDTLKGIQLGQKKLRSGQFFNEGDGLIHRINKVIPFLSSDDAEQLLKRCHECLLEGRVEFKGLALPLAMLAQQDQLLAKELPRYKLRLFSSASPAVDTLAEAGFKIETENYSFNFQITGEKLIVTVDSPKAVLRKDNDDTVSSREVKAAS